MPYFIHRQRRLFYREEGQGPLMWSRPDRFRRAVDSFLRGLEE